MAIRWWSSSKLSSARAVAIQVALKDQDLRVLPMDMAVRRQLAVRVAELLIDHETGQHPTDEDVLWWLSMYFRWDFGSHDMALSEAYGRVPIQEADWNPDAETLYGQTS